MSASKQNIKDIDFIIQESIRLNEILQKSYDEYINEIGNPVLSIGYTIGPPKDLMTKKHFKVYLSDASIDSINTLSNSLISSNRFCFNITPQEAFELTKEAIYRYIHDFANSKDEFNHTKLLNKAIKIFKKSIIQEQSIFFPCNLNNITTPIKFGKLEILPSKYVENHIASNSKSNELKKRLTETSCYIKFNINNASYGIAQKIASSASDLLRGIFSIFAILTGNTRFKLYSSLTENSNFQFYLSKNEKSDNIDINYSRQFGPNLIPQEQLEQLMGGNFGRIASECVDRVLTPTPESLLIDRLVDSIIWFGDAHAERNQHSKIIKIVTALERLVTYTSDNKNEISKLFNARVTFLANSASAKDNLWSGCAKRMYKLRSDLVHGTYKIHQSYEIGLNFSPMLLGAFTIVASGNLFKGIGLSKSNYESDLREKLLDSEDIIT